MDELLSKFKFCYFLHNVRFTEIEKFVVHKFLKLRILSIFVIHFIKPITGGKQDKPFTCLKYIIFRVTVVKDRSTRKSKGVAFILFLNREDAKKCVQDTNYKEVSLICYI